MERGWAHSDGQRLSEAPNSDMGEKYSGGQGAGQGETISAQDVTGGV